MLNKILILDFGSQFTQLIARRIREINVYCEVHPYDVTNDFIQSFQPQGIILSGSPHSVYDQANLKLNDNIFQLKIPILGICYGMHIMAQQLGGVVESSNMREFGYAELYDCQTQLLTQLDTPLDTPLATLQVWMSHGDKVTHLPHGFQIIASTTNCKIAGMADLKRNFYALQFHPEVTHTTHGLAILRKFIINICQCQPNWTMPEYAQNTIADIKQKVGNDKVILALSGGVDSSVAALIIDKAIGANLICIFVDNGLLRLDEAQQVMDNYKQNFGLNIIKINAQQEFYDQLTDIIDPEIKRKIIGKIFIDIFQREAAKISQAKWLAQGTIYPDVIESAGVGKAHNIKSHHNVGGLPKSLNLRLLEPLRSLFKDEVRQLGLVLGLSADVINRHPFPGPGLAVRILGAIKLQYITLLQQADAIFIDELRKHNYYTKVSQAFAVFLPVKSVGVMGDCRTYDYVISLRAVTTTDFMTAAVAELPFSFITHVANRIINEVQGINRVVYDISSKPPSTIEWE